MSLYHHLPMSPCPYVLCFYIPLPPCPYVLAFWVFGLLEFGLLEYGLSGYSGGLFGVIRLRQIFKVVKFSCSSGILRLSCISNINIWFICIQRLQTFQVNSSPCFWPAQVNHLKCNAHSIVLLCFKWPSTHINRFCKLFIATPFFARYLCKIYFIIVI